MHSNAGMDVIQTDLSSAKTVKILQCIITFRNYLASESIDRPESLACI